MPSAMEIDWPAIDRMTRDAARRAALRGCDRDDLTQEVLLALFVIVREGDTVRDFPALVRVLCRRIAPRLAAKMMPLDFEPAAPEDAAHVAADRSVPEHIRSLLTSRQCEILEIFLTSNETRTALARRCGMSIKDLRKVLRGCLKRLAKKTAPTFRTQRE